MPKALKVVAFVAALVVVTSACNSRLIRPPATVYADSGEYRVTTTVDVTGERERRAFPAAFTAFVPSTVPLHPGDAINFEVRDTGEPHTVALGKLVDAATKAVTGLGSTVDDSKIESLPAMKRLPTFFPQVNNGKVPKPNRSASMRCFQERGTPPLAPKGNAKPCKETEQPDFDGTQGFYSSGLLEDGEPFRVKLSGDIEPGSYSFMCLVHRSQMTGTVEVRPKDIERPTVAELRTQAQREADQVGTTLEPPARVAANATGRTIRAGTGPSGISRGLLTAYIPDIVKILPGEAVKWIFYGTHSISFEPSGQAKEGFVLSEGDELEVNPDAWNAVPKGDRLPAEMFNIPAVKKRFDIDGGSYDGDGPFSSGVIKGKRPTIVSYALRFPEAGKYTYSCLVHHSMRGTIEVAEPSED